MMILSNTPKLDLHGFDRDYAKMLIEEFISDNYKMKNYIFKNYKHSNTKSLSSLLGIDKSLSLKFAYLPNITVSKTL